MYQISGTGTTKNLIQLKEQHGNVHFCFANLKPVVFSGAVWLTTRAGSEFLWMWWWTFGFHEMWVISWVAENRIASQEGLCFTELV